ncbi:MAG TPA: hypothetical protein EYH31_14180 [Anaerolineae bacterium]|nr:hypothetical protein [Anaerolineae bacterium]
MSTTLITKSVRLTPEEADELARIAQQTAATESALMKKWVLEGLRAQKLERAIQAYMRREVDLRGGAALAGVSYNRFLREVQARHIVILEDSAFLDRLYELAETFENPELQDAIRKVEAASSG